MILEKYNHMQFFWFAFCVKKDKFDCQYAVGQIAKYPIASNAFHQTNSANHILSKHILNARFFEQTFYSSCIEDKKASHGLLCSYLQYCKFTLQNIKSLLLWTLKRKGCVQICMALTTLDRNFEQNMLKNQSVN